MDLNIIRSELRRLSEFADDWAASGEIAALERDMMLDKLRTLYELVRFDDAAVAGAAEPSGSEVQPLVVPILGHDTEPESTAQEEHIAEEETMDLGEVLSLGGSIDGVGPDGVEDESVSDPESAKESEPEAAPEIVPVEEPAAAPVPAEEPAAESEPEAEKSLSNTLFGPDEESLDRHRHKQRLIMSLYDTVPAAREPKSTAPLSEELTVSVAELTSDDEELRLPELGRGEQDQTEPEEPEAVAADFPVAGEAFAAEGTPVLGDVIGHDRQTLADTLALRQEIASELRCSEPVDDLFCAIGINDKFLMIRDLFDGDGEAFEKAVGELNACTDLDDCMIHIAENYAWNPDCDGAKLMMELLERKFA